MLNFKTACLCTASLVALTTAASAQDTAAPSETAVVTGSRVISDIANSPTPVTAVTSTQLVATSPQGLTEALEKLPVFMGSTGAAQGARGANNLNLRNFGPQRNLILFDSHKLISTQANGAVNVDIIPQMLIQRVDVVTGGASAVYGSDAVTGVVNYVLDKNYSGIKYDLQAGDAERGYSPQFTIGLAGGFGVFGGRGHIEATVRYQHIDATPRNALPYLKDGAAYAYGGNGSAAAPYFQISDARRNDDPFGGLIGCGSQPSAGIPFGAVATGSPTPLSGAGTAYIPGCAAQGMTFDQNGIIGPYDQGQVITGTLSNGGTGRRDYFNDTTPMSHNINSFGRFSYNVNDNIVASIELRATEVGYFGLGPNNGLPPGYTITAARPTIFEVNNPFLTPTAQALLASGNPGCPGGVVPAAGTFSPTCVFSFVNYMATLDGVTAQSTGASNQQDPIVKNSLPTFNVRTMDRSLDVAEELSGQLDGRWDWDLYYSHDEARERNDSLVNQNFQDTYAAEDAVVVNGKSQCYVDTTSYAYLYPHCDPINPFGPSALTATSYASFTYNTAYTMTNKFDDLYGTISGSVFDLPAGPVKAALTAESRWMGYQVVSNANPGTVNCLGLRICSTYTPLWYQTTLATIAPHHENVTEVAGEVNVPLLKDAPLAQNLAIDFAGRYTDYAVSGSVETWKIGPDWTVDDNIKFRATMSVDIRAPTLNELYQPFAIGNSSLKDTLTGKSADLSAFTAGNPSLVPETAHTYTVGTVLTPTFIPNLTVSLDYYRINLYNAITSITYTNSAIQGICIASQGTSGYCSLAVRNFPAFGAGANTTTSNFPNYIINKSLNSATQKTEGVDFEVDYNFDLDDAIGVPGAVSVRNFFTYQPYVTNIGFAATATTAAAAPVWTPMPKSRDSFFLTYGLGNWSVNVQDRWLGGYDQNTTYNQFFVSRQDRHVPNYNQIDMTINKKFNVDDSVLTGYISITDLTNALYPIAEPSLTNASSNPGGYPAPTWGWLYGRYYTIGIKGEL